MAPTIGIPRALLHHRNDKLWPTFFESLGCRTVLSPETNKEILARGTNLAVDESCLPLKILLGHVEALRGKCDSVMVPRLVSMRPGEKACVKYWGMYDICRNVFEDLDFITYSVDEAISDSERRAMFKLGSRFSRNPFKVRSAYDAAKRVQHEADSHAADNVISALDAPTDGLRVLVVAHSYNLHDALLGKPVTDFLSSEGVEVVTSDHFEGDRWADLGRSKLSPGMYWTYNAELLGSVDYCRDKVDGMVFLVTFPCGPDSLMIELARRKVTDVPLLVIVLDELQAEAGLRTRLESFVDIVRMRKGAAV